MREHFLLDPDLIFLNHGSFGACPRPVIENFQRWQLEMERNPVAFLGRRSGALLAHARERLAQHLGARGADLVFVPNATTGVNTVAGSLALRPGDEVLATDHEYGACDATWQRRCQQAGATYRRVEVPLPFDSHSFVQRLMAAVTPRTRLIFVSHITSATALIFPVAALCAAARERGVLTLVDGAHAPGQVALNLQAVGADFYTGNAHKWLCAPKAAAFLHARPEHHGGLHASVVTDDIGDGFRLLILNQLRGIADNVKRNVHRLLFAKHPQTAAVGDLAIEECRNHQVAAGFKIAGFVSLDDEGLFARLLRGGSVRGHHRLTGGADG